MGVDAQRVEVGVKVFLHQELARALKVGDKVVEQSLVLLLIGVAE